ncbi:MAG: TRAP transporter substrate-binding protein DctP [Spirochaetes bacterium]|nr:TRAP transporter substrate-binding protein DctP [Spirochaetota bacterium]
MRINKVNKINTVISLMLISVFFITSVSAAKKKLIRITAPVPAGDDIAVWCQEAMDRFNARTNGVYKMQVFPGGQLAGLAESLDLIRTGAVEGGIVPLAAFSGSVPEFSLAELPFLYNNGEANAYAETGINEVYTKILEERCNQKSLGCMYVGTLNILSTKKPIKTLEDLKGLIIGCDNPPSAGLMKTLGGSGIIVDFSEDFSNLQKGVIDSKTSAPQYLLIAKLYEVSRYYTIFHGLGSLYAITINLDTYNKMPDDVKKILNEEMSAVAKSISLKYVKKFYDLIPVVKSKGVKYYYLPKAERDRWKALAYKGTLAELAKYGDVGKKIRQIADEANAKFPYAEK